MAANDLTAERLRELLDYDPETGVFTRRTEWRAGKNGCVLRGAIGSVAGCREGRHGYVLLRLDGALHKAHRLAWLYMIGEWPKLEIDHVDGDSGNNAWSNLREVDRKTNMQNIRRKHKDGLTSRYLGVSWSKKMNCFVAQLCIDGRQTNLGRFDREEDAHEVYIEAKRRHHDGCTI